MNQITNTASFALLAGETGSSLASRPEILLGLPVKRQFNDDACPRLLIRARSGVNITGTALYLGNVGY